MVNEWMISFISLLFSASLESMSWCSAWSLHPPPEGGAAHLASVEELRGLCHMVLHITHTPPSVPGGARPGPKLHRRFLLYSLTLLMRNCLNLPFGTQGRSRRRKPFFYGQEMGDVERLLYPGGPHRFLLSFTASTHPCWRTADDKGCLRTQPQLLGQHVLPCKGSGPCILLPTPSWPVDTVTLFPLDFLLGSEVRENW